MNNNKYITNNIQAEIILKTWNEIPNQIDLFRKSATEYSRNRKSIDLKNDINDYIQSKHYNNISILGGRGTGKTSLLIKLKQDLILQKNSDIIFDIITPDVNHKEDILGWIISLVIEKAKDRQKKLENKGCLNGNCNFFEENSKSSIDKYIHELKQDYFFRKSIYEELIAKDYTGRIEYLKNNEERLNADVRLSKSFKNLIDELKNISKEEDEEPLFIFIFDDVDIHAEKINEVLTTIMTYLSHPNIVNIIAADYESALENVTLKMLQQDGILDNTLIDRYIIKEDKKTLIERRDERAYDFLKKVLPPTYRHKIYPLNNKDKYVIIKEGLVRNDSNKVLNKILTRIDKDFIIYSPSKVGSKEKKVRLYDYMSFLDDTIRGISNVMGFIETRTIDDAFVKEDKIVKFNFLREFLDIIIDSNKEFRSNKEIIQRVINLSQNNKDESKDGLKFNGYINYYAIVDVIEKDEKKNSGLTELNFKKYYDIFILGNLFEILIIVLKLRYEYEGESAKYLDKLHGLSELKFIVNKINKNNIVPRLVPNLDSKIDNKEEIQEVICIKQNIFSSLKYHEIEQLFKEENSGYLESIYIDSFNYKGSVVECIGSIFIQDREWSSSVADWIINNSPSNDMIKYKSIEVLENKYKYSIDPYDIKKYDQKYEEINNYLKDNDIFWNVSLNLSNIVKSYIDDISFCKMAVSTSIDLEERKKVVNDELSKLNDLENESTKNINIETDYNDILKVIEENMIFINNKFNVDIWKKIKDSIVVDINKEQYELLKITESNIHELKVKEVFQEYNLSDEYLHTIDDEIILINTIEKERMVDFIIKYYTSYRIVEILKNHPNVILKELTHKKEKYLNELKYLEREIKARNRDINIFFDKLSDNEIFKYSLRSLNSSKSVVKKIRIKKNIINGLGDEKIRDDSIGFIQSVINFYKNNLSIKNSINFENLLEDFTKEIDQIKSIDNEIIEHLRNNVFDLNQIELRYYINKFKLIGSIVTTTDIDKLRKRIISIDSEKNEGIERILTIKEKSIQDNYWNLKTDIFKRAFYMSLYYYLELKVEENRQELDEKIRTKYLLEQRKEFEKLVEFDNFSSEKSYSIELIPFAKYLKANLRKGE